MMTTTEGWTSFDNQSRQQAITTCYALEDMRDRAIARAEKAEHDAAIYRDAFKDATMANTVAAQNLAMQEAKTVQYRADWIKATRERDHYRNLLREERKASGRLEAEYGWVTE